MLKTIAIVGAGPGVGMAVAERFGAEGFRVALVARNAEKLEGMVKALQERGIEAAAFIADIRDRAGLVAALGQAIAAFGAIDVLEYSPTPTSESLLPPREMTEENEQLHLEMGVLGAITAVRTVLPSMLGRDNAAILFTTAASAQYPVTFTASFGVAAGATLNYARVLNQDLGRDGIYVGIVSIAGLVVPPGEEHNRNAQGLSLMTAAEVAGLHWELYSRRDRVEAILGDTDVLKAYASGANSAGK